MAWTDTLLDLMPDTITHAAWVGMSTDGYATATYSTATSDVRCRIKRQQKLVRTFEGVEELSTTTVWIASTSTYSALDKFTFGDGSAPVFMAYETPSDQAGVTHSKLYFG